MSKGSAIGYIIGAVLGLLICLVIHYWNKGTKKWLCDKAQKDGELCLGYGGDEDEPCERCKNCIKCECGYY